MSILKGVNLNKTYVSKVEEVKALKDVDIEVNRGDFTVINGPSGSGKTTLLNILSGIGQPDSGQVFVDGLPFFKYTDSQRTKIRRNKIGLVFLNINDGSRRESVSLSYQTGEEFKPALEWFRYTASDGSSFPLAPWDWGVELSLEIDF